MLADARDSVGMVDLNKNIMPLILVANILNRLQLEICIHRRIIGSNKKEGLRMAEIVELLMQMGENPAAHRHQC